MSENKSLIRSTRAVTQATLASRILGFLRDVIIAKYFGTGMRAQAFFVAFRIPNLFRHLVGESSANGAVIPVLSSLNEQGKRKEFWQAANCLLNILLIFLAGLVLLGELCAPYIVRAIAPGFARDPEKLLLTIRLTRLVFPYLLLIGLSVYAMAVLNSLKCFTISALAPCMLNISLILCALFLSPRLNKPIDALALGVLCGGILQIVIQVPLLIKKGFLKHRSWGVRNPRVKEIGKLLLPRTLGVAVYQLNILVDTILGSFAWIVGQGAVAALYYSNRLIQFPLALFGVAIAQVAIPTMSGQVIRNDFANLKKTVSFSLRSMFVVMVPATVGMMMLAAPLVKILFQRGSFTAYSTDITVPVLFYYCLGLTGYAGIRILASCYYALRDTATPVKVAVIALLLNVSLNLILMWPLKVAGLALATAISSTFNFLILLFILHKRIGEFEHLLMSFARSLLAALAMAVVVWVTFYKLPFLDTHKILLAVKFGISLVLGIMTYTLTLKVYAKEEAEMFLGWVLRRK